MEILFASDSSALPRLSPSSYTTCFFKHKKLLNAKTRRRKEILLQLNLCVLASLRFQGFLFLPQPPSCALWENVLTYRK
jgi:hypothetical protein